jgi:hypothetical protein
LLACRRYFTCALKHAQELAEQVKITAATSRAGCVEMQEQVRRLALLCCLLATRWQHSAGPAPHMHCQLLLWDLASACYQSRRAVYQPMLQQTIRVGKKRCGTCRRLIETNQLQLVHTSMPWTVRHHCCCMCFLQVEMMLLDVFLEGLFEIDLRRVNSEEVGHAMNTVLLEANERIKFPLRKMFVNMVSPRVSAAAAAVCNPHTVECACSWERFARCSRNDCQCGQHPTGERNSDFGV